MTDIFRNSNGNVTWGCCGSGDAANKKVGGLIPRPNHRV